MDPTVQYTILYTYDPAELEASTELAENTEFVELIEQAVDGPTPSLEAIDLPIQPEELKPETQISNKKRDAIFQCFVNAQEKMKTMTSFATELTEAFAAVGNSESLNFHGMGTLMTSFASLTAISWTTCIKLREDPQVLDEMHECFQAVQEYAALPKQRSMCLRQLFLQYLFQNLEKTLRQNKAKRKKKPPKLNVEST